MNTQITTSFLLAALLLTACATPGSTTYSGSGGMAAFKILPEVYLHHYQHGFTGRDAMGWDANMQFAWSRIGAAKTCAVPYSSSKVLEQLIAKYGQNYLVHGRVGIDFHHMQSKGVSGFCSDARIAEMRKLMPEFERGEFPKVF